MTVYDFPLKVFKARYLREKWTIKHSISNYQIISNYFYNFTILILVFDLVLFGLSILILEIHPNDFTI